MIVGNYYPKQIQNSAVQKNKLNKGQKLTTPIAHNPAGPAGAKNDKLSFGITGAEIILGVYFGICAAAWATLLGAYAVLEISEAIDKRREKKNEELGKMILKDQPELAKQKKFITEKQMTKILKKAFKPSIIKPKGDGKEAGLNRVAGFSKLKYKLMRDVLNPLCEIKEGKTYKKNSFDKIADDLPNGIMFYGPRGTGKSYIAKALADHYQEKGGKFEEIKFSDNDERDVKYLEKMFHKAEGRFEESGKKRYTVLMLDEIEKKLSPKYPKRTEKFLELSKNSKDRGVIVISTTNSFDETNPNLLEKGRADFKVPVATVENFEVADMINYSLKKNNISHQELDYFEILKLAEAKNLQYKPEELENTLKEAELEVEKRGKILTTNDIKEALIKSQPDMDFDAEEQLERDNELAQKTGGYYEY